MLSATPLNLLNYRNVNRVLDFLLILIAFSFGLFGKYLFTPDEFLKRYDLWKLVSLFLVFYFGFIVSYLFFNPGSSTRLRNWGKSILIYTKMLFFTYLFSIAAASLSTYVDTNRIIYSLTFIFSFSLISIKEKILENYLRIIRENGHNRKKTIAIIDSNTSIQHILEGISENSLLGVEILGYFSNEEIQGYSSEKFLGKFHDLDNFLDSNSIDLSVFFVDSEITSELSNAIWACESRGIEVWIRLKILHRMLARANLTSLGQETFIQFSSGPAQDFTFFLKGFFDRALSLCLICLLLPLFLFIYISIKFTSKGSPIYIQKRAGLNGNVFNLFKFRTMVYDADVLKDQLLKQNEMDGPAFKIEKDPRVTRLGRFLRKTSLDELPQLFNVLRGEMSLVGPRPMELSESNNLKGWPRRRLSMKPGITCIWQISGRNEVEFDHWMRMDLEYVDNWSFYLDLIILLKTIPAVIFGRGAR